MISNDMPISISTGYRLQWEPAQDCHVLLYPEGLIKLNQTAGMILSVINDERSASQIISVLSKQFPGAEIESDVEEFLETALENRWICVLDPKLD